MADPVQIAGPMLTNGKNMGTPLDWFDLPMALTPGRSESTYIGQLRKALAYWQARTSGPDNFRAGFAVTWLTAEIAARNTPPLNNLHIVYPV